LVLGTTCYRERELKGRKELKGGRIKHVMLWLSASVVHV